MPTIVYLHGFLSSPLSAKAQITQAWLSKQRPDIEFLCPSLSSYPQTAHEQLLSVLRQRPDPLYAIGSSLGGYWATVLVERGWVDKAVLINPAVFPGVRLHEFVGSTLKHYYSDELTTLTQKDIDFLLDNNVESLIDPTKYWLMVQKGDETLDYRHAVSKYQGARQHVEEGGNHGFEGYEAWLPDIMKFFIPSLSR